MPNEDRPPRGSWRSPAPPRGTPIRAAADESVADPTSVDVDVPSIAPPMLTPTPLPAPLTARPAPPPEVAVAEKPDPPAETGEDPRALARRLAQEAKARLAAQKPAEAAVDAKAGALGRAPPPRKQAAPPPPPIKAEAPTFGVPDTFPPGADDEDLPPTLDDLPPLADDEPLPPMKPAQPLSSRSLPPPAAARGRSMTAEEALRAALATESEPAAAKPSKARKTVSIPPDREDAPAQSPAPQPARGTPARDPAAVVAAAIPGASVASPVVVLRQDVFRALWRAHRARALHDGNLMLVATASVLLDAVERVPGGGLVAVRIGHGGREWAGWVDTTRGVLLGVAEPADVFLAGL